MSEHGAVHGPFRRVRLAAAIATLVLVLAGCTNPVSGGPQDGAGDGGESGGGGSGGGTPQAAAPVFDPSAGTYSQDITVSMSSETAGATIHYTTDGSDPGTGSPVFDPSSPIAVAGDGTTVTVRAIAVASGFSPSDVAEAGYAIDYGRVSTPQFNPPPGTYGTDIDVSISTMTGGATIHYTVDGSEPTTSSPVFDPESPIAVAGDGTSSTIKALAVAPGFDDSEVAGGSYTIVYPPVVTTDALSGPGSLVYVVTNADPGTTVTFDGDYTITATGQLPATPAPTWLDLDKDITIDGAGHTIILDAAEFGRHFTIRDPDTSDAVRPTLTLRNMTLRNGVGRNTNDTPASGGSIYNFRASLVLENVTIEGSSVTKNGSEGASGGAIVVQDGTATITGSSFQNNVASRWGGAIFIIDNGSVTIEDTTFVGNRLEAISATGDFGGGAVHVQQGSSATIRDTVFLENSTATADGGAIDAGGSVNVINSQFIRNSAGRLAGAIFVRPTAGHLRVHAGSFFGNRSLGTSSLGGAIRSTRTGGSGGADITIVSSVFVGNEADFEGGAVFLQSPATVTLSTFVDNQSGSSSQDIFIDRGAGISNSLILRDTVDPGTPVNSSISDGNLTSYGDGNFVVNVALVDDPDAGADGNWGTSDDHYGNVAPDDQSAALNVGDDTLIPPDILDLDGDGNSTEPWPYDFLGNPRRFGNFVDMAAHESQNPNASPGRPLAPTFNPPPGRHALDTSVSITSEIQSATVYYTTDGSTPDPNDLAGPTSEYTGSVLVDDNGVPVTINAVAVAPSGLSGEVAGGTWTAFPMDATVSGGLFPLVALVDGADTVMRSFWAGVATHAIGSRAYAYITADDDPVDTGVTVLGIGPTGELTPVQTIVDTASMNLGGARYPSIVESGGASFLAVAGTGGRHPAVTDEGISVLEIGSDGQLTHRDAVDSSTHASLTGVYATTAITVDGSAFVIASARGPDAQPDDALSVFELSPAGELTFTDSVTDSEDASYMLDTTRHVRAFHAHGNAYVAAVGFADDGFSIFELSGSGQLTNVANATDDASRLMARPAAITPATVGASTYIIVAGSSDDGVSVFEFAADGTLTPVEDLSNASTAAGIGDVVDMTVYDGATGDYLIVADRGGGGNGSVSLFSIAADGTLSFEETEPDTASVLLGANMSASVVERDGVPILIVASPADGQEGAQSVLID